jgi:hypothetical protein
VRTRRIFRYCPHKTGRDSSKQRRRATETHAPQLALAVRFSRMTCFLPLPPLAGKEKPGAAGGGGPFILSGSAAARNVAARRTTGARLCGTWAMEGQGQGELRSPEKSPG